MYSLGVTCIYLLTQVSPFDLFDTSEHEWVWRQFLVNNSVSDELGRILDKMIEFGTRKRYQSATEILQDLQVKSQLIQTPVTPVIQTSSPPQISSNIVLKSAKGVNYSKLEELLKQGKWKEADQETAKVMLQAANRISEGWLRYEDINNFPCEDLRTIDQLWVKYSNGKFGFSVQKKIWLEVGGKVDYDMEKKLGDRIGWRKKDDWINYDHLTFSLQAPLGYLPRVFTSGWGGGKGGVLALLLSRQDF